MKIHAYGFDKPEDETQDATWRTILYTPMKNGAEPTVVVYRGIVRNRKLFSEIPLLSDEEKKKHPKIEDPEQLAKVKLYLELLCKANKWVSGEHAIRLAVSKEDWIRMKTRAHTPSTVKEDNEKYGWEELPPLPTPAPKS